VTAVGDEESQRPDVAAIRRRFQRPGAMKADSSRWTQVTPSAFAWELAALDWVRQRLPDADPWHAWSNFELVHDHGVAEVDLLVVSPAGIWVVEIMSRPGTLTGDNHTWTWRGPNGSLFADDNPLVGCDRKAKRLKSLVQRTRSVREQLPFLPRWCSSTPRPAAPTPKKMGSTFVSPSGRTGVVAADGPLTADRSGCDPRKTVSMGSFRSWSVSTTLAEYERTLLNADRHGPVQTVPSTCSADGANLIPSSPCGDRSDLSLPQ
jgi:hypothetical protein